MNSSPTTPTRVGRPRIRDSQSAVLTGREQILDAAAQLFAEFGFSGTSTRAIAEKVGIRQQSLYSHFAGKEDILIELLGNSVRPSIEFVHAIEGTPHSQSRPAAVLFALARFDTQTLIRTPHNIGTLYLLPEVQNARYDEFRAERDTLRDAYGRLGLRAATPAVAAALPPERIGTILIQLAELVIQIRREGTLSDQDDVLIARSCLRVLGLSEHEIDQAQTESLVLLNAQINGAQATGI